MAFRRTYARRGRTGATRKIMRSGGQITQNFKRKIKSVCAASQPQQRRVFVKTPPIWSADKKFRRMVRLSIGATATTVTNVNVATQEAAFYGISTPRWTHIKVLSVKVWGTAGGALQVTVPANGTNSSDATFVDYGDGCTRSCVAIDMPVTFPTNLVTSTNPIVNFTAAQAEIVDVYCEFS